MQPEQYSPDPTLTPQQHHVLSLLAQGVSITAAAAAAGIHRSTAANWRRTVPAFARELDYACRERSLFWHDHAADLAQKAVEVISTILHNESAAPSLRLRAAMKILAIASDPQPAPLKPFPSSAAEAEAVTGRSMHPPPASTGPQLAVPLQIRPEIQTVLRGLARNASMRPHEHFSTPDRAPGSPDPHTFQHPHAPAGRAGSAHSAV